ncbi:adhesive plaque matrix protein 2 isoform X1 [Procambarus clarkii]|uniref:adhesive plaque matrix protein 2 isoform X1 n=1 Tax=Procambarus clarkii TaxID=6728 RepID=UPI0037449FAE
MRLILVALAVLAGVASAQHQSYSFGPLLPIAPFSVYPRERVSAFRQGGFRDDGFQGSRTNPCSPSPCGPNTLCEVTRDDRARCRCLEGYVTESTTIEGCKPQCVEDEECPDDHRCRNRKCVRVCEGGACGLNAYCDARNHKPICECPPGYRGNAQTQCTRSLPELRDAPKPLPVDPCYGNPCGENADCKEENGRAVCRCPHGYDGNPLTRCNRGECIENRDCPSFKLCRQLKCVNPCSDSSICWANSECQVKDYQVICTCRPGYEPDGDRGCRRFDPSRLCLPSPCGRNTHCKVKNERAVCSCIDNYLGNPLEECRPECEHHEQCDQNQHCRNNRCRNPCVDSCGENAICDVRNHQAVCSCPEYYQGDPYTRCFAECLNHDECPDHQACHNLKCANPCTGACGTGADCKVVKHQAICSCPKGYTGHPFEHCRPFTDADFCQPSPCGKNSNCEVGTDRNGVKKSVCTCIHGFIGNPLTECRQGDCTTDSDCSVNQACYLFECVNPCVTLFGSVCGEDAICTVRDRKPVCSCPSGYSGDARERCTPAAHSRSRYSGGSFK